MTSITPKIEKKFKYKNEIQENEKESLATEKTFLI